MSLLEIPREPERKNLKVEMTGEVVENFEEFVAFAKQQQSHATPNNVLEYILEEFFASTRKDMKELRGWLDSQDEGAEAKAGDKKDQADNSKSSTAKSEDKKGGADDSTSSRTKTKSRPEQISKTKGEDRSSSTRSKPKGSESKAQSAADQTGEIKVPQPEGRRIERRRVEDGAASKA